MTEMAGTLRGPQGIQGIQGIPGGVMAWKGTYSAGTSYSLNDAVYANGSGYYSLQNSNQGHTPPAGTSDSYWSIFAFGQDISGWILAPALTFGAADAPVYTATCSGDYSAIIMPKMRMKMTQGGSVKYFIVVKSVYSSPNTTITLYGGTDYTLGSTITLPYFSIMDAPAGFPVDPTKWTVELRDTVDRSQSSPVNGTYYNLGSLQLSIPIGIWYVTLQLIGVSVAANGIYTDVYVGASTANNSFSDLDLRGRVYLGGVSSGIAIGNITRTKTLALTSKTLYYLLARTDLDNQSLIGFNGASDAATILHAVCAYL